MSLILDGTNGLSDVDGSAATPAIRGTDANTGIFFPAADTIAFAEGGAEIARFDSSGNLGLGVTPSAWFASQYRAIQFPNGWTSLASDSGNGTVLLGSNFYADGNTTYRYINSNYATLYQQNLPSGQHRWYTAPSGTAGNAITFTQAMTLTAAGYLGLGTTSPSYKFVISNGGAAGLEIDATGGIGGGGFIQAYNRSTSAYFDFTLYAGNTIFANSGTEKARIDTSGNLLVGAISAGTVGAFICPATYSYTTGSGANVFVDSSGRIMRSTSSLKYKTDVQNSTHGLADVLKLRSVTYRSKEPSDGDTIFGGFIAEEVHEAGLSEFVQYADDGTPDALSYGPMVSVLVKAIQELKSELDSVKTELAALKGN